MGGSYERKDTTSAAPPCGDDLIFSILPHNTILNSLEVAKILATNYDIVINHGYQCSQPLYRKFHIDGGAIRFSFHVYNTKEDVDYIFESLSNILISTKM